MDPVTAGILVMGGVQVVSGLAQLWQSEKARGASEARLDKIEELWNQVKDPKYNGNIYDPPDLIEKELEQPQFAERANDPDYIWGKLNREQLQQLGKISPKVARYVEEKGPETLQGTEGTKRGREAQMAALERLQQIGAGEYDPEYQEIVNKSQGMANSAHQARAASTIQDFARRGLGGSGLELASQIGSNAAAQESQAATAQSAATQAYKNRLAALSSGASLGGDIARDEYGIQEKNNNTINSFNERMAKNRQQHENETANIENDAERYNKERELKNIDRQEELRREDLLQGNRIKERAYNERKENQHRNTGLKRDMWNMKNENVDRENRLERQKYEDDIAKTQGRTNQLQQRIAQNNQNTQDRNNAIQGGANIVTNVGSSIFDRNERLSKEDRDQAREDKRWARYSKKSSIG